MKTKKAGRLYFCDGCRSDIVKGEHHAIDNRKLAVTPGTVTVSGTPVLASLMRVDLHLCAACAASPPPLALDDVLAARRARWGRRCQS